MDQGTAVRNKPEVRRRKSQLSEMGQRIAEILSSADVQPTQWVSWLSTNMNVSKFAAHKWLHNQQQQISDKNIRRLVKLLSQASGRPLTIADLRKGWVVSSETGNKVSTIEDAASPVIPRWFHKLWEVIPPSQRVYLMDHALETSLRASVKQEHPHIQLQRREPPLADDEYDAA